MKTKGHVPKRRKKSKKRLKEELDIQKTMGSPRITWEMVGCGTGYRAQLTKHQENKYNEYMKANHDYGVYDPDSI